MTSGKVAFFSDVVYELYGAGTAGFLSRSFTLDLLHSRTQIQFMYGKCLGNISICLW
jgi:hypothetical protein